MPNSRSSVVDESDDHHQSTDDERFNVPRSSYTPYYCEENVYKLVEALNVRSDVRATWACFVSNVQRHALVFNQNASRHGVDQESYVVWDYHVFAIAAVRRRRDDGSAERVVAIDPDSKLGHVVDLPDYVERTFFPSLFRQKILDPSLACRIRIVRGNDLLQNFASDRSHMLALDADGNAYVHPPPCYPSIRGPRAAEPHNLWSRFLDMEIDPIQDDKGYGHVLANPEDLLGYQF